MTGNESGSSRDPLEALAEEFVERHRRGQRPSIDQYAAEHPELADGIRELFPALVTVERLKPGPSDVTGDGTLAEGRPPRQLGDYGILREIGRGGMGVVYEAQQESLGRHVALKVLRSRFTSGSKQLARFEREARAAARLHHTNIVPVFGVGQEGGTHYYVMQLIQGQPLDEVVGELKWLRQGDGLSAAEAPDDDRPEGPEQGRASGSREVARAMLSGQFPRRQVATMVDRTAGAVSQAQDEPKRGPSEAGAEAGGGSSGSSSTAVLPGDTAVSSATHSDRNYWQSVARIGLQLAHALDYAHGQGVLHRDIKPSNILLDAHGTTWVTDFGLAKVAEQEGLTESGDVVGTLRYMAPEALRGTADGRTDLRGLGLILYELIALRPAFDDADPSQLIGRISEGQITRLRRINPEVPRDLETIVMKSVDRDPVHRYQTAEELAADLERFTNNEPIHARRVSVPERFARWCRRNPVVAGLTTVIAVLLVAAAVVSSVTAVRFRDLAAERETARIGAEDARDKMKTARDEARAAKEQEAAARGLAEDREKMARDTVDKCLTLVAQDPRLKAQGLEPLRNALLEEARQFHEDFVKQNPDDPKLQVERAWAYLRLASTNAEMGQIKEAEAAYKQSIQILRRLDEGHTDVSQYGPCLATCHKLLGGLYQRTGRLPEAEAECQAAIEMVRRLVAEQPRQQGHRSALAENHVNLANLRQSTGRMKEAESAYRTALRLWDDLVSEFPNLPPRMRNDQATALNNLGVLYRATGRPEEAEEAHLAALQIRKRLLDEHPNVPRYQGGLAGSYMNLGAVYVQSARLKEAAAAFEAATQLQRPLADEHPAVPKYRADLTICLSNLGRLYGMTNRLKEAEQTFQEALETASRLAADHPDVPEYESAVARTQINLGGLYQKTTRTKQAEASLQAACDIGKRLVAKHPRVAQYGLELASSHRLLGALYLSMRRGPEAEVQFLAGQQIAGRLVAECPDVPEYRNTQAFCHFGLGLSLQLTEQIEKAQAAHLKALQIWTKLHEEHPITTYLVNGADAAKYLGKLACAQGSYEDSLDWYQQAISALERVLEEEPGNQSAAQFLKECRDQRVLADALRRSQRPEDAAKD